MLPRLICSKRKFILILVLFLLILVWIKQPKTFTKFHQQQKYQHISTVKPYQDVHDETITKPSTKPVDVEREFFVFNRKCKMPYVNTYSEEFMSIYMPPKFKTCTNEPDLVSISYDRNLTQYIFHIDEQVAAKLLTDASGYACLYYEIVRGANDSISGIMKPVEFVNGHVVPRYVRGALVVCHEIQNITRILQRDAFSFVQVSSHKLPEDFAQQLRKYPSIIMLGIDSMSRWNFKRTMPETAKYVSQQGWYELEGYNKVGDNSLPNLLTLLSGLTPSLANRICNVQTPGCFDRLPFVWRHFKNAGYLTAFGEDVSSVDTFNYLKHGFRKQPVDYYLRPFLMTIEQAMSTEQHFGIEYCVGRRLSFQYVYDFCEQVIQRLLEEAQRPVFGTFWTNSFTHNRYDGAATLDKLFLSYLQRFEQHKLFERSIVILLSDHGARFGPLMELSEGFLEERLPMLHIYLPDWYRAQNPKMVNALVRNRRRLSSTFDLHETFKHILKHARVGLDLPVGACASRSLLKPLPRVRGCDDACIPDHWCSCEPYTAMPLEGFATELAQSVVYRMNKFLKQVPYNVICHRLKLKSLYMAERKLHFDADGREVEPPKGIETYRVKFSTSPREGIYRATVQAGKSEDFVQVNLNFISRLNLYRNSAYCVQEVMAKKFCICTESPLEYAAQHKNKSKILDIDIEYQDYE